MCKVRAFKMFCTKSGRYGTNMSLKCFAQSLAHPRHRRNSPTISIQGGDYTKQCTTLERSRDLGGRGGQSGD